MTRRKKISHFKSWLPCLKTSPLDIKRLKVFLDSAPGDYFGWSVDNDTLLYSPGFSRLFGQERFSSHEDIQNTLEPFDAASFEATLTSYIKDPRPKTLIVETYTGRYLELSFRWGESDQLHYHVLWAQDITDTHKAYQDIQKKSGRIEKEIKNLQNILDALPQPIWNRSESGRIVWCNKSYSDFFSTTEEHVLKDQKNIFIKPKDSQRKIDSQKSALTALKTGEIQILEGHGIIGGERHSLQIQEKPYPHLDMTVGLLENLTWKEEIEANSQLNMSAYRTIFGALQTAVALYNSDHQLTFYNAGFSQLWQLEESWLNQKPKLEDILEKLRETRRLPEQTDFKSYKKNWIDMFTKLMDPHSDIIALPDGTILRTQIIPHPTGGLGHVFEDVTSNLELESSYNTLMAVQKETIDNLAEGIVVYGSDGRVKLWNYTFSTMWSLNPEDLEGEPHITKILDRTKDLFAEKQWADRRQYILGIFENRLEKTGLIKRNDGIILDFSSVLLPDGGTMFTYADVSDSIRVEDALREKNTALETAQRLKTEFLAKISYQLRTPLSTLIGFNDIMDQEYFGALNAKQKEYTTGMKDAGHALKTLIDDILDLTSIEAGIMSLKTEDISLPVFLKNITDITQDWANDKQIKLTLKCPKTIGSLHIDPKRIKHALTHLIQNAIASTPTKGSITLKVAKKKDAILISVQDTGTGIPQVELETLFKPFGENNIQGGAGLGLTLVKNVVELHDGSINIESVENKGTTITLSFPV